MPRETPVERPLCHKRSLGCVKPSVSQRCAELFSQFSFLDRNRRAIRFRIDEIETDVPQTN
jgi:hypothetical protein